MDLFGEQSIVHPTKPRTEESRAAWSLKASDYSCVPLCPDCHTRGPLAYHRIGKRAFERVHAVQFASIAVRLRREWKQQRAA